jgi:hypothetical protein
MGSVARSRSQPQPPAHLLNMQLHKGGQVGRGAPRPPQHLLVGGGAVAGCGRAAGGGRRSSGGRRCWRGTGVAAAAQGCAWSGSVQGPDAGQSMLLALTGRGRFGSGSSKTKPKKSGIRQQQNQAK